MTDSVFGSDQNPNPATNNADPAPVTPSVPPELAGLVGPGAKYKSVDEAIKSLPHKELHIGQIETENAKLRKDLEELKSKLDKASNIDSILEKINSSKPEGNQQPNSTLDEGAIASKVLNMLKEQDAQATAQNNIDTVDKVMKEKFGADKAKEMVVNRAKELGVDVAFLMQTAARSPKAFYTQMGVDQPAQQQSYSPSSSVNTENLNPSSVEQGTKAYYDKIRKENERRYWSPEVQMEMFNAMKNNRNKFYGIK